MDLDDAVMGGQLEGRFFIMFRKNYLYCSAKNQHDHASGKNLKNQ